MPKRFTPEQSLLALYPEVAATWHPERNGELGPQDVSSKNSATVWWRCAHGHDWSEKVATRTSMPGWKRGDVAACKVCSGYHVIMTFACGHTVEAKVQYADPARECKPCRDALWAERQANYETNRLAGKQAYAESEARARELLATLDEPDVPAPLLFEWRNAAVHEIRAAISRESAYGKTGAIGQELARQRALAQSLMPEREALEAAQQARAPYSHLGRALWPAGWLHLLGDRQAPAPSEPDLVDSIQQLLMGRIAQLHDYGDGELSTAQVTADLTEELRSWGYERETRWRDRRWNVFRELTLPVAPANRVRYGRLDLTLMRPDKPDVIVEIDAAHNDEALEKLRFAHAAGAVCVWVRWRGGRVEHPQGVSVVDLVEVTRGLVR